MEERGMRNAEAPFVEFGGPRGRYGRYPIVLGRGTYKTVYKAFDRLEGKEVAWNRVDLQQFDYVTPGDNSSNLEDCLRRLRLEVQLLKNLDHKNIIRCFDSWVDSQGLAFDFITEMCTSGTLREYRENHKSVDQRAIRSWVAQILDGLVYLHAQNPPIAHRDIKCDNIFVNGNTGELKIGDLGSALVVNGGYIKQDPGRVSGTPLYMAPEILRGNYDELVDIYAFGMCVLELIALEDPYEECRSVEEIFVKSRKGEMPCSMGKVKDPQARDLIQKCLGPVRRRPSAMELLEHPFVRGSGKKKLSECDAAKNRAAGKNGPDWGKRVMKSQCGGGAEAVGLRLEMDMIQRQMQHQMVIAERTMDEFLRQGEQIMEEIRNNPHNLHSLYPKPGINYLPSI